MLRAVVVLLLAAWSAAAQAKWSVTLFAVETPTDLLPPTFRMLEHRVLGLDDAPISVRVGDTDVTVDIRESFRGRRARDEDGEPPPSARLALNTRMGLGRRRSSSSVNLEGTPRMVACDLNLRRRTRAELFVAALLQAPDAPAADAGVLADACLAALAEQESNNGTEDAPDEVRPRFDRPHNQLLDILVRLPLAELLSADHPGRVTAARALSEAKRVAVFAAAGDVASVTKLAEDPIVDQWTWIRALAEGWRQTSDKELRARAGIRLFRDDPSVYGKLLADDIESGRAVIPEMPDKQKIVDDLNVMATWRNTSPAWLGLLLLLGGSIVVAVGARVLLKRLVA